MTGQILHTTPMPRFSPGNEALESAMNALLQAGFSVTVRRTKHGYVAECHSFEEDGHKAVYGRGNTWRDAVLHAGVKFDRGGYDNDQT